MSSYNKPSKPSYFKNTIVILGFFTFGFFLINTNYVKMGKDIASKFSFMNKAEAMTENPVINKATTKKIIINQARSMSKTMSNDNFTNKITFE